VRSPGAIERLERVIRSELQQRVDAHHPVGPLAVNQVSHDIESGPGADALVLPRPDVGKIAEQRVQSCRRPLQKTNSLTQLHPPSPHLHGHQRRIVQRLGRAAIRGHRALDPLQRIG